MHAIEILSGILGLLLGCLIGMWLERRKLPDLEALKAEHATYRQNVETHFETTAQLAHQMADNYRNMYQHLAQGAVTLCEQKDELQAPSLTAMRKHIEGGKKTETATNEHNVPGPKPLNPSAD